MKKFYSLILIGLLYSFNVLAKNMILKPGEVTLLSFVSQSKTAKLFCRNQEMGTVKNGHNHYAILAESYFSNFASFDCEVREKNEVVSNFNFKVLSKDYKKEELKVAPGKINFSFKDQKRKLKEDEVYKKVLSKSHDSALFKQGFQVPLKSLITSPYGVKRLFNGSTQSHHFGVDFRAAEGTKIPASNSGRVVYSGNLFLSGNVVFIDHGLNIFTVYNHLSKSLVKVGDTVKKGQVIGLSGSTGRITGPHLHWDVFINGHYVDGLSLVEETKNF